MAVVTIFLILFFVLGLFLGPLILAAGTVALSPARGKRLAEWAIGIGMKSIYRPALTFNAADELTLKKRKYDEKHDAEKVTFGGVTSTIDRYLFDPQNRIQAFYGTPLAIVDELFGAVVDPRDVSVGRRLWEQQESGTYTRRVEKSDGLEESVLGVFEMPKGGVGVRLPDVRTLFGGSFDSQLVRKVREWYRISQAPKTDTTALRQLLVPIGAFVAVIIMGMFAAGQSGGGGGGGGAQDAVNRTEQIGSVIVLFLSTYNWEEVNWRDVVVGVLFGGAFLGLAAGLFLAFPPTVTVLGIPLPLGVWCIIFFSLGIVITPFVAAWFGRSLGPIGMLLGKLYTIIGLLAFDKPVLTLTENENYEVREYDDGTWDVEPKWYRFALTRIGIGFDNSLDVWPDTGVALSPNQVKEMAKNGDDSKAPARHVATDAIALEDIMGFVPKPSKINDDKTYVRTDRSTGWFEDAGKHRRLMQASLQSAKEDFGGGEKPVGDKWIMAATLVAMGMAAVFDWVVFF